MPACPQATPTPPPSPRPCQASVPCVEFYHDDGSGACDVFCRPTDSCLGGHYTCARNGSRMCLPGWTGPNCTVSRVTGSSECTCPDGGTWLNGVCVGAEVTTSTTPASTVETTTTQATTPGSTAAAARTTTSEAAAGTTSVAPTQSLIARMIAYINAAFPILSPGEKLQLLSALLQDILASGSAVPRESIHFSLRYGHGRL